MPSLILIRGGGDLASGIALHLVRCGLTVVITEIPQPLAIRRTVSFAEAMYEGTMTVEGISSKKINDPSDLLSILSVLGKRQIPVMDDPECKSARLLNPLVIVDARMLKIPPTPIGFSPLLYIGIGPGFVAGINCQVVVESNRGHTMGRVFHEGSTISDTGHPGGNPRRVIRATVDGVFKGFVDIGATVKEGQLIAEIDRSETINLNDAKQNIFAPITGLLRGILHSGIQVSEGMKIGDIDARNFRDACSLVSDKALAIGGGVLEAIISNPEMRTKLWI